MEKTGASWTHGEQCRHLNGSKEVRMFAVVWNIFIIVPPPLLAQPAYRMEKRGGCACEAQAALTDYILACTGWSYSVTRARGNCRFFKRDCPMPIEHTHKAHRIRNAFFFHSSFVVGDGVQIGKFSRITNKLHANQMDFITTVARNYRYNIDRCIGIYNQRYYEIVKSFSI